MNRYQRDYMTTLQYENQALKRKLQVFESDACYLKLQKKHRAEKKTLLLNIKSLESELIAANKLLSTQYRNWLDVLDDVQAEHRKQLKAKDKTIDALTHVIAKKDVKIGALKEQLRKRTTQIADLSVRVEEAEGMCLKLHAQVNRDFQNSSISSSMSMNKKKISNSREKSGKRPGAQPGHPGHRRKTYEPSEIRYIEPPAKFWDETRYIRTDQEACRQLVELRLQVDVLEYRTPIFRDKRSGRPVHASFPDYVVNEVNYGASVKSFCLLLNQDCHVSLDKTQRFLSDLTDGRLKPSKGMLNGLAHVFATKSQAE